MSTSSSKKRIFLKIFTLLLLLGLVLSLFACNNKDHKTSKSKTITIAGSTTILPVSERWAHLFFQSQGTRVVVQGGGSTHGIDLVKAGKVSIGSSSRDLSEKEAENLKIIPICRDVLAVIVNRANPVENISREDLSKVFSGEITNWKELGGQDLKIQVINRESGSGTRSTFEQKVMCGGKEDLENCKRFLLNSLVMNSNYEVRKSVQSAENSIGYLSFGFLKEEVIKPLKIDGKELNRKNIDNKEYQLSRELYYLISEEQELSIESQKYLDFIKSPEAQAELIKEGFEKYY